MMEIRVGLGRKGERSLSTCIVHIRERAA